MIIDAARKALHVAVKEAIDAGLCVIPPREDGSKAPEAYWKEFQEEPASIEILRDAYGNGDGRTGIGIVCGAVSGHLECLDFDTPDIYKAFKQACGEAGLDELLEQIETGYSEFTPNGFHLLYQPTRCGRCRKLARTEQFETLIEVKAEGGYIITSPSYGNVNLDGPYVRLSGSAATIVHITMEDREALYRVAESFDKTPKVDGLPYCGPLDGDGDRVGDDFNRRGSWSFLIDADWLKVGEGFDPEGRPQEFWRRPGKNQGNSAVLHPESGLFYVFSTSTPFPVVPAAYNKFRTYTFLLHEGDFRAARRALQALGFKDRMSSVAEQNGQAKELRRLQLITATTIAVDRPRWVWDLRIPIGGTTLIPGREGLGKTAFVGHLAAQLTRGELPGEWAGRPGAVVYIGYEDDRATILVPRLVAAGADLSRFFFVDIPDGGTFLLDVDVDRLHDAIVAAGMDVALVIVDPLDSHLGGGVDTHRKSEVQASIQRLAELVQELRCGAAGLAHLNKSETRDLLTRVVGSVGFTTSVRAVLGIGEHPSDQNDRICVLGKANMCDKTGVPAVRFRVEGANIPHPLGGLPINTARVVILGEEHGIDPNLIITGNAAERQALEEATDWLQSVLSDGPVAVAEIRKMAASEGIAFRTLQRSRKRIGVVSERDEAARFRPATWRLDVVPSDVAPHPLGTTSTPPLTSTNGAQGGMWRQTSEFGATSPDPPKTSTESDGS